MLNSKDKALSTYADKLRPIIMTETIIRNVQSLYLHAPIWFKYNSSNNK